MLGSFSQIKSDIEYLHLNATDEFCTGKCLRETKSVKDVFLQFELAVLNECVINNAFMNANHLLRETSILPLLILFAF